MLSWMMRSGGAECAARWRWVRCKNYRMLVTVRLIIDKSCYLRQERRGLLYTCCFYFSRYETKYSVNNTIIPPLAKILSLTNCNAVVLHLGGLKVFPWKQHGALSDAKNQRLMSADSERGSFKYSELAACYESFPGGIIYCRIKMPQMLLSTSYEYHFRCSLLMGSSYNFQNGILIIPWKGKMVWSQWEQ